VVGLGSSRRRFVPRRDEAEVRIVDEPCKEVFECAAHDHVQSAGSGEAPHRQGALPLSDRLPRSRSGASSVAVVSDDPTAATPSGGGSDGEPVSVDRAAAAVIRQMVGHEDELRNQRLGWLFALNGFLFAALGFAWSDADSAPLVVVLALLGISVAFSAAVAEHVTRTAIEQLRVLWRELPADARPVPLTALESGFFKKQGGLARHVPKLYPWRLIPWMLTAAWISLIVAKLTQG
jgi:hypothetical protein